MADNRDSLSYYTVLGLSSSATTAEIKKAFKEKARLLHPDHNPAPDATEKFQLLNEAYRVLSNSELRANYDAQVLSSVERGDEPSRIEPIVCDAERSRGNRDIRFTIRWSVSSWCQCEMCLKGCFVPVAARRRPTSRLFKPGCWDGGEFHGGPCGQFPRYFGIWSAESNQL